MITIRLSEEDFLDHLSEQIQFLKISCEIYDRGMKIEGKRLATTIRTIVHDTGSSKSILGHLSCKNKMYYLNTAIPESLFGLCSFTTTTVDGGKSEYTPPLENLSEKRKENPLITFQNWWEDMKVLSDGNNTFSRKDLVLNVANKDGGAHVDEKLPKRYAELTRQNTLNFYHEDQTGLMTDIKGVELASIRQIAFELTKSLGRKFPDFA